MITANVLAFVASIIMVTSGLLKSKKQILFAQGIEIVLFIIGDIIIGGYSAAIINFLSLVRNIFAFKGKLDLKAKIILLILSTVLVLVFNNLGLIGLLPLIAMFIYLLFINTNDIKKFKLLMIVTMFLWAMHDIFIGLYVSFVFDILTILSCLISLLMLDRKKINHKKKA